MTSYEFPLSGDAWIPKDSGYPLFGALCHKHPWLHHRPDLQIAPIRGTRIEESNKHFICDKNTKLHIRGLSSEEAFKLALTPIEIGHKNVLVGSCTEVETKPSPILVSKLVVFPGRHSPGEFKETFMEHSKLADYKIEIRKIGFSRVSAQIWAGYTVVLSALTDDESMRIQNTGVGKNTSMGCGVFYPRPSIVPWK